MAWHLGLHLLCCKNCLNCYIIIFYLLGYVDYLCHLSQHLVWYAHFIFYGVVELKQIVTYYLDILIPILHGYPTDSDIIKLVFLTLFI